jgi:hypothetical protein
MFGNAKRAKLYTEGAQTEGLVVNRSDTTGRILLARVRAASPKLASGLHITLRRRA